MLFPTKKTDIFIFYYRSKNASLQGFNTFNGSPDEMIKSIMRGEYKNQKDDYNNNEKTHFAMFQTNAYFQLTWGTSVPINQLSKYKQSFTLPQCVYNDLFEKECNYLMSKHTLKSHDGESITRVNLFKVPKKFKVKKQIEFLDHVKSVSNDHANLSHSFHFNNFMEFSEEEIKQMDVALMMNDLIIEDDLFEEIQEVNKKGQPFDCDSFKNKDYDPYFMNELIKKYHQWSFKNIKEHPYHLSCEYARLKGR